MTREDALQALSSTTARERLKAVRFFSDNGDRSDLATLRDALMHERVMYVRTSLELAIKRIADSPTSADQDSMEEVEVPVDVRSQIRTEITAELTGQLLHEISSPVGLIASAAGREVPNYEESKTKSFVDTLKRVFEAIEQLKIAAAVPKPTEFDLADLLSEVAAEAIPCDHPQLFSLIGTRPMLITSDRALLRMAFSNAARNAVEAVSDAAQEEPHPITVTWGATDIDYWVVVLDRGSGIVGPVESAFEVGTSTKRGHSGFGLTIAKQAIETLGGACSLQPATENGARFEVRWPR